ncbi:hypothetical protein [Nocardia brasiliensis]|uniref:hypothetical protein n=1 Tax=Nocardia brasiliensis TaxID=37326 RepID=UPI00245666D8|nr:hypothetical protein [Nocardia brasiliensis]
MDLHTTIVETGRTLGHLLCIPLDSVMDSGWGELADECVMHLNARAVMADASQPIAQEI